MTERVSVIIPAYNAQRFLAETIDSVLAQTRPADEIIVIDDGSTDGTATLLKAYERRVRTESIPNGGVSAARNRGTALATGHFLQYLDADDLLPPTALAQRVDALRQSGCDAAYSGWQRLVENSQGLYAHGPVTERRLDEVDDDPQIALATDFWAPPAAWTFRRSLVERIGHWNERLLIVQDARFVWDAAVLGARFTFVPGVLALHRVHRSHESLSRRDPTAFVRDVFKNATEMELAWRHSDALTLRRAQALTRIYDYTARSLLTADYTLFRENLQCLYRLQPKFALDWPKVAGALACVFGPTGASWMMDHFPRRLS